MTGIRMPSEGGWRVYGRNPAVERARPGQGNVSR